MKLDRILYFLLMINLSIGVLTSWALWSRVLVAVNALAVLAAAISAAVEGQDNHG